MNVSRSSQVVQKHWKGDRLRHLSRTSFVFILLGIIGASTGDVFAQQVKNGLLPIGGFQCISLKELGNNPTFDLYNTGDWNATSFRMDVWRRLGVPFWYPKGTGVVSVAGPDWRPDTGDIISSIEIGSKAGESALSTSNVSNHSADETHQDTVISKVETAINDGDNTTAWSPTNGKPRGKVSILFASSARVNTIRFLASNPDRAPRDYSIGLILPDGSLKEIVSVDGEDDPSGDWRDFAIAGIHAKGIYLDVRGTVDGMHLQINELEAEGKFLVPPSLVKFPSEVTIPMGGVAGKELHFIGNVGSGFRTKPGVETAVGEYNVHYNNGQTETIPLIAGRNVADLHYGHFVPGAQFAYGLKPHGPNPGELSYHLNEMVPVEAEDQLMMFSHRLAHPDWPIQSVEFRATRPDAMLMLAAVTLQQSGPRINPLVYNGKMVRPYPADTPRAKPSSLNSLKDRSRRISLDGNWLYTADPGNEGIDKQYFSPSYDVSQWKTMAVPSQWFLKDLNYNGVVWFRRKIEVPASFPGSVEELVFGAVDYDARVWVNGVYVGRHVGAYTSFKINVSSVLRKGESNLVVVRVDCPLDPGYERLKTLITGNTMDDLIMPYGREGSTGGIYLPVYLRARGDVGIDQLWAASTISDDLKHADEKVSFLLENSTPAVQTQHLAGEDSTAYVVHPARRTVEVRATLMEPRRPGVKPRSFTATKTIELSAARIPVELPLSIDNPLLWYPWEQGTPYLHTLKVEVLEDGHVLDTRFIQVGIRQVEFNQKDHYVLINHHRIFLKGMVNDDVHWRSLMDRTGYAQRIRMQKDANLNIIRLIAHQSQPDFYELCDEMGMLVWQEMPLQWGYSRTQPIHQDILKIVRETIDQTRSHASVVGWSAWNEGGQPEFSDRITAMISKLDGTRPVFRSSGRGMNTHIYPTSFEHSLYRRTPLWAGFSLGFVSETGAYGIAPEDVIQAMAGDDFLHFDSAEALWDNFNSFRSGDGPLFLDAPNSAEWPKEKIRSYILAKIKPNARWFSQYQQSQFENARAQRFAPSTSLINCRFDDAFPLGYSGAVVAFNGQPKPAYYAVQAANQPVLPILFLDFHGAKDVRVVNDYWFQSWKGAKLTYRLTSRDGKVLRDITRSFDLPPDSNVTVLNREEAGDLWHVPGGFYADLTVRDSSGKLLSENRYDFTEAEVQRFVTSIYPLAPVKPINAVVLTADQATTSGNVRKVASQGGTYSKQLLEIAPGGVKPRIEFTVNAPKDSDYYLRISGSSGAEAHKLELVVDGEKADLERYGGLDADLHLTRDVYSTPPISWYPGWHMHLAKGPHHLVFRVAEGGPSPRLTLDAISLQTYKPLPNPFWLPAFAQSEIPNGGTQ